jgi:hypothetical protein
VDRAAGNYAVRELPTSATLRHSTLIRRWLTVGGGSVSAILVGFNPFIGVQSSTNVSER